MARDKEYISEYQRQGLGRGAAATASSSSSSSSASSSPSDDDSGSVLCVSEDNFKFMLEITEAGRQPILLSSGFF